MSESSSAALKRGVRQLLRWVSPKLHDYAFDRFSKNGAFGWRKRIAETVSCPDNGFIPRVPDAGKLVDEFQIMHNGIKILRGSHYGQHMGELMLQNKGVHEPQEERLFQEVLKKIPPGSNMIELGAYWSFYSMWFCKEVPGARAYMVEPVAENLLFGKRNFAANGFEGTFLQALVGRISGAAEDGTRIVGLDDLAATYQLEKIAILHCDIQGFEMEMLLGGERTLPKTAYIFISTHSEELHRNCEDFLATKGFLTVSSISPRDSYSVDGILVCRSRDSEPIPLLQISRRSESKPSRWTPRLS